MKTQSISWYAFNWIFGLVFLSIGILNIIHISTIPGLFYIILSTIFIPLSNSLIEESLGLKIPNKLKLAIGLVVLWMTLGVGDLAEFYGL